MATLYPGQIDNSSTLPPAVDNSTPVDASNVNVLRDAILAVEQALGTNPGSIYTTVRNRLDIIETLLTTLLGGPLPIIEVVQSVPTAFYVSVGSGIATAPSQLQMVAGSNFTFGGNIYVQANTSGGCKIAMSAPSGAYTIVSSQGPTGYDAMLQTGVSSGSYGTQVGTGVYAGTIGAIEAIAITGSVRSVAGCTGPVLVSILPVSDGHTLTILPGSNISITAST